jgi:hypothetical protein
MIIFDVKNGGISARLLELPTITKKDGGVFLNNKLVPFRNPNSLDEGVITAEAAKRVVLQATKLTEMKKGDATWR